MSRDSLKETFSALGCRVPVIPPLFVLPQDVYSQELHSANPFSLGWRPIFSKKIVCGFNPEPSAPLRLSQGCPVVFLSPAWFESKLAAVLDFLGSPVLSQMLYLEWLLFSPPSSRTFSRFKLVSLQTRAGYLLFNPEFARLLCLSGAASPALTPSPSRSFFQFRVAA